MTLQETFQNSPAARSRGRRLSFRRILMGGRIGDLGRFPRYLAFALIGGTLIWAPITGYLRTAPLSFKSGTSLILPGSGASASMNLNGIGQASSYANSAFSSNSVSPTETYKRLIGADRILEAAARSMGLSRAEFGKPRIDLVDQTSLIHLEITGGTAEDAQARGDALLGAFFAELDALRTDEQATREDSGLAAIADYRNSVAATLCRRASAFPQVPLPRRSSCSLTRNTSPLWMRWLFTRLTLQKRARNSVGVTPRCNPPGQRMPPPVPLPSGRQVR